MLRKAASMVKPMMRKRGWKVGTLAEFLPDEPQLLGLNINRTERILIRLRYHHDSRQFLGFEQILDTLLHELSHIVFGPHHADFNNLWNELRDEHQSLLIKGYTGEGFLTQGHKLGGRRVPPEEMRRQARNAAEKRKSAAITNIRGNRLGGAAPPGQGGDMRKVIADAASRRNSITQGCASGRLDTGRWINQQEQDSFRTTAEQDDANDPVIARALQDLMYEEEMQRLGAPTGGGGLTWDAQNGLQLDNSPPSRSLSSASVGSHASPSRPVSQSYPTQRFPASRNSRPVSRVVLDYNPHSSLSHTKATRTPSRLISTEEETLRTKQPPPVLSSNSLRAKPVLLSTDSWACPRCTLHNPLDYLLCGACGLEQPPQPIPQHKRFGPTHIALNLPKPPPQSNLRGQDATPFELAQGRVGWNCLECGKFMESHWWTCSLCGTMKLDS